MRKAFLLALYLTAPVWAQPLKTDVLFVGAHPDDDSTVTATLARLSLDEHKQCAVVCATRGEGGGNALGLEAGRALGILREEEQRRALGMLGVERVYYLDREDFGFTLSAEAAAQAWNHDQTLGKLVRYVRALQPDVVITMNPVPRGHGHHQFVARLATEAFWKASDPDAYPDQLRREFLRPWQPRKLYYALEYGADGLQPDLRVDARELSPSRQKSYQALESSALRSYRSQGWDNQMPDQPEQEPFVCAASLVGSADRLLGGLDKNIGIRILPRALQIWNWGEQRVSDRPRLEAAPPWKLETADALTVAPRTTRSLPYRVLHAGPSGRLTALFGGTTVQAFRFIPPPVQLRRRPGEAAFARWADAVGMPELVQLQQPQYAVTQGRSLRIGGTDHGKPFSEVFPAGSPGARRVLVHGQPITLHTVPSLTLPGGGSASTPWEGKVDSAVDLSASFTVSVRGQDLFFHIEVTDDVITANLTPSDNKAHWRTDSVELCLDPGHSEHPLTTCKLGIVPFNLQGKPMAARDADAAPGPVSIPVQSWRSPTGYGLEVLVPQRVSHVVPKQGFGLNVLVYDADNARARPGENCNEARTAWSPAETVQGQPWLWGRVLPTPRAHRKKGPASGETEPRFGGR